MSDLPVLSFVDPAEADATFRVVLWAAPGEGKTVAAASAPDPIVALSADRPGAYRFARRHHAGKDIRETRYVDHTSLVAVYRYLRDTPEIRTVIVDPFGLVYDKLVEAAPKRSDGDPDYQRVNQVLLNWLYSLREFDVNVVLVAHEKLNDGKRGDGKLYPQLGGPALTNKILAESDIVARVRREEDEHGVARFRAQLAPAGNVVCKESTGVLGAHRDLDLTEWFDLAADVGQPDESDIPFSSGFDKAHAAVAEPDAQGTLA